MDYHIHSNGKDSNESCDARNPNESKKICKIVAKIVVESMDIGWNDRRVVEGLIYTALKPHFEGRDSILKQYLHTQLDILADTIRRKFVINAGVNYGNATHAKFKDIINEIEETRKFHES